MKNSTYRIISSEIMAKGWSQLLRLKVSGVTREGRKVELIREVADHGHGAAILPIDATRHLFASEAMAGGGGLCGA